MELFDDEFIEEARGLSMKSSTSEMFIPILYGNDYGKYIGWLRLLMNRHEWSKRTLWVISRLLELNPSHFGLWNTRAMQLLDQIIFDTECNLDGPNEEWTWLHDLNIEHQKSYQVWQYRQIFMERWIQRLDAHFHVDIYEGELEKLQILLEDEPKNYHCWSYRHWFVHNFCLDYSFILVQELEYIDSWISRDCWNNSAWNYRFHLIKSIIKDPRHSNLLGKDKSDNDVIMYEISYAISYIELKNEAVWNYCRGWIDQLPIPYRMTWIESLEQEKTKKWLYTSRFFLSLKLDVLLKTKDPNSSKFALEILDLLLDLDPIRENYWKSIKGNLLAHP
jgi:protein farnesyltransferase/geranylgeranyltransferase type-1 subunit alpha